jgi:hypothetical protein
MTELTGNSFIVDTVFVVIIMALILLMMEWFVADGPDKLFKKLEHFIEKHPIKFGKVA